MLIYIYHIVHNIPSTYLSCNQKFVPFDCLHSSPSSTSGSHNSDLFFYEFNLSVIDLQHRGGASQVALLGKEPACQCRRRKRRGFNPWVRKTLWRRAWQPTLVFLSEESHEQRSLGGYCPWDRKELDMTEVT